MASVIKFKKFLPQCACGENLSLAEWREYKVCRKCRSRRE